MQQSKEPTTGRHGRSAHLRKVEPAGSAAGMEALSRIDHGRRAIPEIARFPQRLSEPEFLAAAYPLMFLSRRMEERLLELFQKGYVKGTVTMGDGNEATAVGFAMPLRPGRDVVSL
jgi:TPP-dependent pyruvate/acetoin dehydrogenase alpha subunit